MIDLTKVKTIAVIGASNNPAKFGNKIIKDLLKKDFIVWPVNPKEDLIEGQKVYHSLADLPALPDMINLVVPAEIGFNIVKQAIDLGVKNIWLQPGAQSDEIIDYIKKFPDVNFVQNSCTMM